MFSSKADQLLMMILFVLILNFIGMFIGILKIVDYVKYVDSKVTDNNKVVKENSMALDNLKGVVYCTTGKQQAKSK